MHPEAVYTLARVAAAVLGTVSRVAALSGRRAPVRPRRRAAGSGDRGGRVPAGLLLAPGAQRRADARAADALAARQRRRAAQRPAARPPARRGRASGSRARPSTRPGSCCCPTSSPPAGSCLDAAARAPAAPARWSGSPRRALAALAAFLVANPYALLDYSSFHHELAQQSTLSGESQGKLGAPKQGGLVYYLWSLTWGLGWVPALAALAGAVAALAPRAARRADARPGRARLPAVHGHRGPLLRPLADAGAADPLPARGVRGARGDRAARRRCGVAARAHAPATVALASALVARAARAGHVLQRALRASCSRARTPAPRPANGCSANDTAGHARSSSSRSRPTRGRAKRRAPRRAAPARATAGASGRRCTRSSTPAARSTSPTATKSASRTTCARSRRR